jgi:RNA polymerase sigma factor (sigma-70 family)
MAFETGGGIDVHSLLRAIAEEDDREAYEHIGMLFEQKVPVLRARAARRGVPPSDDEDVVRETVADALDKTKLRNLWEKYREKADINAYLYNILRSKISAYKRRSRSVLPYDTVNDTILPNAPVSDGEVSYSISLQSSYENTEYDESHSEAHYQSDQSDGEVSYSISLQSSYENTEYDESHSEAHYQSDQHDSTSRKLRDKEKQLLWDTIRQCLGNDLDWQILWLTAGDDEMDLQQTARMLSISHENARCRYIASRKKLQSCPKFCEVCEKLGLICGGNDDA